jgi:hypothetical protein
MYLLEGEVAVRAKGRALIEPSSKLVHLSQCSTVKENVYYAARFHAKVDPDNFLCVIHNEMDQNKTWLPRLADRPTILVGGKIAPLPISLIGMITHGRQPGIFAHFGLSSLWSSNLDFTVTSIAKSLQDFRSTTMI